MFVSAWDETASGLPSSGGFALVDGFGVEVATLSAALFVAPQLFALLVEAPLLVWLEHYPRQRLLCLGLLGMACSMLGCAVAPGFLWFSVAWALYYPASGIACSVAQAALMDAEPERREQNMGWWSFAGWAGDLLGPVLLWVSSALTFEWRGAFATTALVLVMVALCFDRRVLPRAERERTELEAELCSVTAASQEASAEVVARCEAEVTPWQALRLLLGQRRLLLWLTGAALCTLMDEVLAVFVGIRIRDAGKSVEQVTLALLAFTAGGVLGLAALEPVTARYSSDRLLPLSCFGCLAAWLGWLVCDSTLAQVPLLLACGVCVAWHYPIAQAQAYRALPGRSMLVAAGAQAFSVFELLLPLGLGFANDTWGVKVALALLAVQPVGLIVVWLVERRIWSKSSKSPRSRRAS